MKKETVEWLIVEIKIYLELKKKMSILYIETTALNLYIINRNKENFRTIDLSIQLKEQEK